MVIKYYYFLDNPTTVVIVKNLLIAPICDTYCEIAMTKSPT